jgi:tetratricopeptide (TPR) repeat protein
MELFDQTGDALGRAQTQLNLAWTADRQHRREDALQHAMQALAAYQAAGQTNGITRALNTVGWHHALLGQATETLEYCTQALASAQALGDPRSGGVDLGQPRLRPSPS